MADQKDPAKKPSPIPEKRPAASSDHDENLIRDDSGEEGTYSGQQQTGLKETSGEADQKKKPTPTGNEAGDKPPDSDDAKSRYGA
jgi:hypothetical protein